MVRGIAPCGSIDQQLVAFELEALASEQRASVEAHLAVCPACLAGFFEVKRAFAAAAVSQTRPAPEVERRLRAAVGERAAAAVATPSRRLPISARATLAVAAGIAAAMLLAVWLDHAGASRFGAFIRGWSGDVTVFESTSHSRSPRLWEPIVDSASDMPVSLSTL